MICMLVEERKPNEEGGETNMETYAGCVANALREIGFSMHSILKHVFNAISSGT